MTTADLEKLMNPEEAAMIGVAKMTSEQRQALSDWGIRMYGLGQHVVGEIADVKYDGRLVILSDGTRWEVDPSDASTADLWSSSDRVVVIDNEMYRLDDNEKAAVEEDDS